MLSLKIVPTKCFVLICLVTVSLCVQSVISVGSTEIKINNKGILKRFQEQAVDARHAEKQAVHFLKKGKDESSTVTTDSSSRLGFVNGFLASIYIIIISELGDKTFFIAAIMSIRNPRLVVYAGAMGALASMTILSAALGYATTIIPRYVTYYLSGILFFVFGVKMLRDAYVMSPNEGQDEYEEVQADLRKRDEEYHKGNALLTQDAESGVIKGPPRRPLIYAFLSKIFIESFVLTFLAEWGDRSQVTTIVLAATKDVVGVIMGGILGHALCTGIAVMAGRIVAQKIPVRWLTVIGGVTFLVFAVSTFYVGPESNS